MPNHGALILFLPCHSSVDRKSQYRQLVVSPYLTDNELVISECMNKGFFYAYFPCNKDFSNKQTFEWRASDAMADIYMLMAALCAAARHGFEMEDALKVAEKTYVDLGVNIHDKANKAVHDSLEQLPASCAQAADELEKDRAIYTAKGVFSDAIIDYLEKYLKTL